jgi:hypothetical protein
LVERRAPHKVLLGQLELTVSVLFFVLGYGARLSCVDEVVPDP